MPRPARWSANLLALIGSLLTAALVGCGAEVSAPAAERALAPETIDLRDPQAPTEPVARGNAQRFGYVQDYRFEEDWFSPQIPVWAGLLQPYMGQPDVQYLEIGVYEGRSLMWVLDRVLTDPSSRATGIDIFVPDNLTHNLAASGAADRVTMRIGASQLELRTLSDSFDVVYIDGSHTAHDVLEDMVLAWRLLEPGGIMILDDYEHTGKSTTGGTAMPEELLPGIAIDAFISTNRTYIEVLHKGYQVALRKRQDVCVRGWWQCSSLGRYSYDWRLKLLYAGDEDVEVSESERALVETLIKAKLPDASTLRIERALWESPELKALDARLGLDLQPVR